MTPADEKDPVSVKELLTSGMAVACYYASPEKRSSRPRCLLLATVRYGATALCHDCDIRRSAVGKGTVPVSLPDPQVLLEVIAARDALRRADTALSEAVCRARQAGQPWAAIGAVLTISRQAAQQRFAEKPRRGALEHQML
jgi:hypothetical protein